MPALPERAIEHMSPRALQALANTPSAVEAPNVVHDPDITVMNGLSGTAGKVDYFVFDLSSEYPPFYQDEAIYGFETGIDKVVVVNAGTDEGLGYLGWIDPVTSNMDYSFEMTGYYGLPDNPSVNDGRVIFQVYGGPALPQNYWFNAFTVDASVQMSDVLIFNDNPFG